MVTVASSAMAAHSHDGGQTARSTFQISILVDQDSTCKIAINFSLASEFRRTNLIIWEKVVMSYRNDLEAADRRLCDITRCNLPLGRKSVLLVGDFRQILPAVLSGSRSKNVGACSKRS